jgi:dimethylargininase
MAKSKLSRGFMALTRAVSAAIGDCELTHLARTPLDVARARAQHTDYTNALAALGGRVLRLPDAPDLPDAVFVEDTAVILDELAIITRPGAATRRAETADVAAALAAYRPLAHITAPATLDGGDVLRVDRSLFVGQSARTNAAGIAQLRAHAAPFGYTVTEVGLRDCLHLKTAVTQVAPNTLLINRNWVDTAVFADYDLIDVDPAEPSAANALLLNGRLIFPNAYPRTRRRLEARGVRVVGVDADELAKAEGGVTCCSLILPLAEAAPPAAAAAA